MAFILAWAWSLTARAEWTNVTHTVGGEAWGYAGVCLLKAVPGSSAMIAGVSEAGLWLSDDLGLSWRKLAPQDAETIRHRPHQIVFDPLDPARFWVSGCYGPSPFMTTNGGRAFQRLGSLTHMDGIGIDFTDPARRTIVVGLHEQARSVHKSADGGRTWEKLAAPLPFQPNGIAFNVLSRSLYAWRSSEKKAGDAILRWDLRDP